MQLRALYIILERWGVEINVTVIFLFGIPFFFSLLLKPKWLREMETRKAGSPGSE